MPWNRLSQVTSPLLSLLGPDGVVVEANKAWEARLGHSLDVVKKHRFGEFLHPEDRGKTSDAIKRVLTLGKEVLLVLRTMRADGSYAWIEWSLSAVDQLVYALGIDLTERPDREMALREEKELFEMLDEKLGLGRWRYDLRSGQRDWTQTVTELYGRQPDFEVDATEDGLEFYHPDDREMIAEKMRVAVSEGTPFEFQARLSQSVGPPRWVESRGIVTKSDQGEALVVHGVLQEIARTRQHRWQANERIKFMTLFQESPDAYVILNLADGQFTDCNPAAQEFLKCRKEELIGTTLADISPEHQPDGTRSNEAAQHWLRCFGESTESARFDWLCRRFDGQARLLEMSAAVAHLDGQTLLLACWRDVTSIRKQAVQLQRANTELEQFAYRTSHDMKAPLATIKNLAIFIEEDVQAGELAEAQKNAALIREQASKLSKLVVDILTLARAEIAVEEVSAFDLNELLHEILVGLQSIILDKKVDVRCETPPGSKIWSQQPRVRLILSNLISNAVKYSDPQKESRFVSVEYSVGEEVHLLVNDNGLGVPESDRDKIFEAFARCHPRAAEGSGLGLSIVQKNVDALGGTITYKKLTSGSQFKVTFPHTKSTTQ